MSSIARRDYKTICVKELIKDSSSSCATWNVVQKSKSSLIAVILNHLYWVQWSTFNSTAPHKLALLLWVQVSELPVPSVATEGVAAVWTLTDGVAFSSFCPYNTLFQVRRAKIWWIIEVYWKPMYWIPIRWSNNVKCAISFLDLLWGLVQQLEFAHYVLNWRNLLITGL